MAGRIPAAGARRARRLLHHQAEWLIRSLEETRHLALPLHHELTSSRIGLVIGVRQLDRGLLEVLHHRGRLEAETIRLSRPFAVEGVRRNHPSRTLRALWATPARVTGMGLPELCLQPVGSGQRPIVRFGWRGCSRARRLPTESS